MRKFCFIIGAVLLFLVLVEPVYSADTNSFINEDIQPSTVTMVPTTILTTTSVIVTTAASIITVINEDDFATNTPFTDAKITNFSSTLLTTTTTSTVSVENTTSAYTDGLIQVNNGKTIGVLLSFSVVGIVIVSSILLYIWRKSKYEESKYVTLSERINITANASRPSTSANANNSFTDLNNSSSWNPTSYVNKAFELNRNQGIPEALSKNVSETQNERKIKFDNFNNKEKDRTSESSF